MKKTYEQQIEELNEERQALAGKLNELMKMKDLQKNLMVCKDEGHVWTMYSEDSGMWEVETMELLCTRCDAIYEISNIWPTGVIRWVEHETEELKEMLE